MCLVCEFGIGVFAAAAAMAPSLGRGATSSKLPARSEFVIKGAYVITVDDALGEIEQGSVHVRDGEIVAVGRDLKTNGAKVIDGRGMIVLPGLVDTHWHMWHTICRNFAGDTRETGFFPTITKFAEFMQPDDMYNTARVAAAEAINSGVTTVHDWCHNNRSREHLGTTDAMIIRTRRLLMSAAKAYRDRGELPEGVDGGPDERLGSALRSQVADEHGGLALDLVRGLLGDLAVQVVDEHARSVLGEKLGGRVPDAARRARHDRRLAVEHAHPLPFRDLRFPDTNREARAPVPTRLLSAQRTVAIASLYVAPIATASPVPRRSSRRARKGRSLPASWSCSAVVAVVTTTRRPESSAGTR